MYRWTVDYIFNDKICCMYVWADTATEAISNLVEYTDPSVFIDCVRRSPPIL